MGAWLIDDPLGEGFDLIEFSGLGYDDVHGFGRLV
jgi:hypothetical protein